MPEVCQHARGSSLKCLLPWTFPGGSSSPRCPEGQDTVPLCQMAQNPQDCTYGIVFTCNDDICVFSLSCDGQLAVCVTIDCFIVLCVVLDLVWLWKTLCKVSDLAFL